MVRCWPVSMAAVFVTFTATICPAILAIGRGPLDFAAARSARRDDAKQLPCGTPAWMDRSEVVFDCNEETVTFQERRYCPHERRRVCVFNNLNTNPACPPGRTPLDVEKDPTAMTTPVVFSGHVVEDSRQLERSGVPAVKSKLPLFWSQMAKKASQRAVLAPPASGKPISGRTVTTAVF
ncbi:hypothetical protein EVAR_59110_1 [Eumeta japonica]|uniref:Uncharacterized protein n=1 Tax=Eumeta variegata TaxID=151549 RepID=A0A4C1Z1G3_EUMVA|nr:hypothetical protein EVAR_59110_1 [Eumeta japonica]